MTALELLRLEGFVDPDGVTIAVTDDAHELHIGDRVPLELALALREAFAASPSSAPASEPLAMPALAALLDPSLQRSSGPSYLVPPDLAFASGAYIEPDLARLANANPGNWHPIEWQELLAGQLGPVAIATVGDRVASICHTPGPLTDTAEVGVWTHPDFRGQRLACATVAAWAPFVCAPHRHVFYSTARDNLSSQRVAARLKLPFLGWTHRLGRPNASGALHPLCSVRS